MELKVLFDKVPAEYRREYGIDRNRENLSRMEIFSLFLTALAVISLLSRVLASGLPLLSDKMLPFTVLFSAETLLALFFVLFSYVYIRKIGPQYWGAIVGLFVIQVLTWAVILSLYNYVIEGDFSVYILAVIAVALVYRTGPIRMAILLCLTALGFSVGYLLMGETSTISLKPINALMYSALGWFISLFLEKNLRSNFLYGKLLEKKNEELVEMSFRDPLTGLYNRRYFIEFLENQLACSRRTGQPLSVILMDLDWFKKINDSMGHLIGDSVLREFSLLIQGLIRDADIVARYGGEEFIVILPQTGLVSAVGVAERIRESVKKTDFRGLPWNLTLTAGVTELRNGDTQETMLARADKRLYNGKMSGRDRIISRE